MINDLFLNNNKRSQSLKQQLFNFQIVLPNRSTRKQFIKNCKNQNKSSSKNHNKDFNNFNKQSNSSQYQSLNWKPKISSKKLFQQPYFVISLDKKRKKNLSSIEENYESEPLYPLSSRNITSKEKNQRQSVKIKQLKHHLYKTMFTRQSPVINNLPKPVKSKQKKIKTPHFNFNLRHMLDKRKTFNSKQEMIQGSNKPFYNFFVSDKFINNSSAFSVEKFKRKIFGSSISHRRVNSILNRPNTSIQSYTTEAPYNNLKSTNTITHQA